MRPLREPSPYEYRCARRLALLRWMEEHDRRTAGEAKRLAHALGVTTRTIYRYRRLIELAASFSRDIERAV